MRNKYYLPLIHKGSHSIYPFYRIGGFGLGNMLFPFFRAICYGIRDGASVLYPLFNQIQPRNFLREKNMSSLRNYNIIFSKFTWTTLPLIQSAKIYYCNCWTDEKDLLNKKNIFFIGCKNYFFDLIEFRDFIRYFVNYSLQEQPKNFHNNVAFHIRLGDFLLSNNQIPRDKILKTIEFFLKKKSYKINIYSDFDLSKLIDYLGLSSLPLDVRLIKNSSPMLDIIDMSNHKIIVGNPRSTFVEWARFLSPVGLNQKSYSLISETAYKKNKISPLLWNNFL